MRAFRVTRIGTLPAGWSRVIAVKDGTGWSSSFDDGGVLELEFTEALPENGVIDFGQELAVEFHMADGSWQEPPNGRVIVESFERLDGTDQMVRATAIDRLRFLARKAYMSVDSSEPLDYEDTAGFLAWIACTRAASRGALAGTSWSFDGSQTSSGQAWQHSLKITIEADQNVLEVLSLLREQGMIEFWSQGRTLIVENAAYSNVTQTRIGMRSIDSSETVDGSDYDTFTRIEAEDGTVRGFDDGPGPLGRLESAEKASGVSDLASINTLGALARIRHRVKRSLLYTDSSADGGPLPHRDFSLGDIVQVRRPGGFEAQRVTGFQVRYEEGTERVDVFLADRAQDNETRLSKASRSLGVNLGGNGRLALSGGSGGAPVRRARVVSSYPGYGMASVVFAGESVASGPYPFLETAQHVSANQWVVVIGEGADAVIHGSVVPDPEPSPAGEIVYMELGPGWIPTLETELGPPRFILDSSGWVTAEGAVFGPSGTAPFVARLPSTMRPTYFGTFYRYTNPVLTIPSGLDLLSSSVGTVILSGMRWHIGTGLVNGGTYPLGVDAYSQTAWIAGTKTSTGTTARSISLAQADEFDRWDAPLTSAANYTVPGGSTNSPAVINGDIWALPGALSWVNVPLVNGTTGVLQAALTSGGRTLLRGNVNTTLARVGWPVAVLPSGYEPPFTTRQQTRKAGGPQLITIDPRGQIFALATPLSTGRFTAFFTHV